MSMQIQMGPPGSMGAGPVGIGGSSPAPDNNFQEANGEAAELTRKESEVVIQPDMAAMKRYKSLRELAPSSPLVTLVTDTVVLVIDLFKLSMASMLSVFVPQQCPGSTVQYTQSNAGTFVGDFIGPAVAQFKTNWDGCTHEIAPHDCTFEENFRCLTNLNKFVLAWNFICLVVLIFHYFLVWRREHFLIDNFKESLTLGRLHVRDIISDYPAVRTKLHKYNRLVFNTSIVAIVLQAVNIITSAILLFGYYDDGYKTYTTFFTNLLLISLVLYNCVSAAYVGLKHELAYSCVGFEPVSYNAVNSNCIKGQ